MRTEKGMSLIEVLIALAILVFVFLSLLGMFPASLKGISDSRNVYSATQIAKNQLEYWVNQGYTWVALYSPPNSCPASLCSGTTTISGQESGSAQFTTFSWQIVPSFIVPGGVIQVDVLVTWKQPAGIAFQDSVRETTWVNK